MALARFADGPSRNVEDWDFRAELRGRLVEDYPTVEDWLRELDRLLGPQSDFGVSLQAADRFLRLAKEFRKPWPKPGQRSLDLQRQMELANLADAGAPAHAGDRTPKKFPPE